MENASKALIMAGSVLMAIIVISVLVIFFDNLRNLAGTQQQSDEVLTAAKFNEQFDIYDRNVYGTELFSLANKIISYNDEIDKDTGYERIHVYIYLSESINKDYFSKKPGNPDNPSSTNHACYYDEKEWAAEYKKLSDLIETTGNWVCETTIEGSNKKITRKLSTLVAMRTKDKESLGFNENSKIKNQNMNLGEAETLYKTYKSDLTKVKESVYKSVKFSYSKTTGRVTDMFFKIS